VDLALDEPAYNRGETVPGDMSLSELKSRFGLEFNTAGYSTVGEFLRAELGPGARTGARIERSGTTLEVEEVRGKFVTKVNVVPG
jgi:CBS domain containing-hemolysin-like protein